MQSQTTALKPRNGILVLSGYGIRVRVWRGQLVVEDGLGRDRRTGALHRATSGLRRLVIGGHAGFVTFEALRWLSDVGAAFAQIDRDGRLTASFSPAGTQDVRLRRAQALAAATETGAAIVRTLLAEKLGGQLHVLRGLGRGAESDASISTIERALDDLSTAVGLEELNWLEALGASAYWSTIASLPVRFPEANLRQIPAHWLFVGPRASPLGGRAHNAASPAHAMLNYCYAVLENEARIALLAAGLDPEMGLLHTDRRFRNSFALDVLEPVRPDVDAFVLRTLSEQTLSPRDFVETRIGVCRLAPDLARRLTESAPRWAARLTAVVHEVAADLAAPPQTSHSSAASATPRLRAGLSEPLRGGTRAGGARGDDRVVAEDRPAWVCQDCGAVVSKGHRRCRSCADVDRLARMPRMIGASVASTARRRAAGIGLRLSPMVAARRAAKISANQQAARRFRAGAPRRGADPELFRSDVLPLIQGLSLRALEEATGVSKTWWSLVKRGKKVPQERHWPVLLQLAQEPTD